MATLAAVLRKTPTDNAQGEHPGTTLGDLLYSDAAKTRVAEEDWLAHVEAIAAGDQRALHALYERAHRIVFTLVMRLTCNRETAEELTVDVFHDVWLRAADYNPQSGTVVGWIMNQARSRAIDRLRFDGRKKRVNPYPVEQEPLAPADPDLVMLREQALQLRAGLAALTADERQAIEIAFFSELTYAQVAERLDAPLGTVKTRIRAGLAKLRRSMDSEEPGQ